MPISFHIFFVEIRIFEVSTQKLPSGVLGPPSDVFHLNIVYGFYPKTA